MDLNAAIKSIVMGCLANESLSTYYCGTWGGSTVKVDDKPLPIPIDMIDVPKGLTVAIGDKVMLIQQHGGQRFGVIGVKE